MFRRPSPTAVLRALAVVGLFVASAAAGVFAVVPSASASAGVGYVRLAQLSPDAGQFDLYLTPSTGAGDPRRFAGLAYGAVTPYLPLPEGPYAVALRAAGAPETDPPLLSAQVPVASGEAFTVAGMGRSADLSLRIIRDDLTMPAPGMAKVRVLQASARVPRLDVSVADVPVATDVAFASATAYREVQPGTWRLRLKATGDAPETEVSVECAAGVVYSMLVLDGGDGSLSIDVRTDARTGALVPKGGVDTGAGGPTGARQSLLARSLWAAGAAVTLGVGVWLMLYRPRNYHPGQLP